MLFYCYRPQTSGVCPSGGVSFSFVSERKRYQKEREFKGCALKNPPIVQSFCAQSKTSSLPLPLSRLALRRALRRENCTKREITTTSLYQYNAERTRAFPSRYQHNKDNVKSNSDHRNSYFTAIPAVGATIRIRISRQYPP